MSLREYSLVVEMLLKDSCLNTGTNGGMIIHHLILCGFASIIAKVVTNEAAGKLDDWGWCDQKEKASQAMNPSNILQPLKPLLLTACERESPNMGCHPSPYWEYQGWLERSEPKVPRLLRLWGSIREERVCALFTCERQSLMASQWGSPVSCEAWCGFGSPRCKWDYPTSGCFGHHQVAHDTKRAVELLIELGANVNAVDDKGISCLARAGDNNELIKLLLRHGAVVTHSEIIAAINSKNAFILEALLSHGADPNIRQSINKEKPAPTSYSPVAGSGRPRPQFDPDEMYLLHYAATRERGDDKIHEEMVKILLDHFCMTQTRGMRKRPLTLCIRLSKCTGLSCYFSNFPVWTSIRATPRARLCYLLRVTRRRSRETNLEALTPSHQSRYSLTVELTFGLETRVAKMHSITISKLGWAISPKPWSLLSPKLLSSSTKPTSMAVHHFMRLYVAFITAARTPKCSSQPVQAYSWQTTMVTHHYTSW